MARHSPGTSEGLEEAEISLKVGEASVGKREGISVGRRFAEKHLEVTTGSFFVFCLDHTALSRGGPSERSQGVN